MEFKDYYKVMGVARDATDAQIKQAYRKLARKYHPDVSKEKDAEARFKEVGEAYEVLKSPEKRAAYDQLGQNHRAGEEFRPPPNWDSGFEFSGSGQGNSAYSDFFDSLFGAQGRSGRSRGEFHAGRGEDQLAFFRPEHEFRNVRLAEHADADFAELAGRLLIFSTWRLALFPRLQDSADPVLAAIAAKGAKELAYHRDYAAQWVIRLGDGTGLSHGRMQAALDAVWPLVDELFRTDTVITDLPGVAADPAGLRAEFGSVLAAVLAAATLDRPGTAPMAQVAGKSGRDGVHTEKMGFLLAELQSVARAHPEATW